MTSTAPKTFESRVLMITGVLFFIVNAPLTMPIPFELPFPQDFATDAFLHRLSAATVLMFFLTMSTYFLYRHMPTADKLIDKACFGLAFIGCVMLFAHEWAQVFFVHPMAKFAPEGLIAVNEADGFNLYNLEAALAAGMFALGSLCFTLLILVRNTYGRLAPGLVVTGFVIIPVLTVMLPAPYGGVIGCVPMAIGYFLLGVKLKTLHVESVA